MTKIKVHPWQQAVASAAFVVAVMWTAGCGSPQSATSQNAATNAASTDPLAELFDVRRSSDQFKGDLEAAKGRQVPQRILFEAHLIRGIVHQDVAALKPLLPEANKIAGSFDVAESRLFKNADEMRGMISAIHALEARAANDDAGFERHLKEAFWLSPGFGPLFGNWVKDYRHAANQGKQKIALTTPIKTTDGKTTTLKALMGSNKAVLIDFWASWCGPCMMLMDDTVARAAKLAPQQVILVGINTEGDAAKAKKVQQDKGITFPWLVEPDGGPYYRALEITALPTVVLVGRDGKVLYNGHPELPELKAALAKVGASL